jgi:hypothetical protein
LQAGRENVPGAIDGAIRERSGNSVPAVFTSESAAGSFIRITKGTVVRADEAASWDGLQERFEMKRINHQALQP